jgi:predicted DNA-binding transcriptional regulator AlpA
MKSTVTIVTTPPAILRRDAAAAYMGISTSLLEQLVAKGKLPKPRQISATASGWLRVELDAAAHALPVSELAPGPGRRASTGLETSQ